jgi:hypothetical protein
MTLQKGLDRVPRSLREGPSRPRGLCPAMVSFLPRPWTVLNARAYYHNSFCPESLGGLSEDLVLRAKAVAAWNVMTLKALSASLMPRSGTGKACLK